MKNFSFRLIIAALFLILFFAGTELNTDTDLSSADASFRGEDSGDYAGQDISGVGDVNGDGYDDFLIGALTDEEAGYAAGQVYLILGKNSGWAMDTNLGSADASWQGESSGDNAGAAVAGVGDVNGDGYDDFIIGAYKNGEGGSYAGQTYLILGKSSGWSMDNSLASADASYIGEDVNDYSGYGISGAGDVNGDGYDDFLIGAYGDDDNGTSSGQTYLILGKSSGWTMNNDLSNVDASFWGEGASNNSGENMAAAGDVNGDGYDDFLIGAYKNADGGSSAGQTYLILGKSAGWSMDTNLSGSDASYIGEETGDFSGRAIAGAGDVNGDGYDDFIIGAMYSSEGASAAGQTYLILGKSAGWSMDTDLSAADASFHGESANDYSGKAVAGVGDVNGDGYSDFIIGAYADDDGGSSAGQTYLIYGKSSGWSSDVNLSSADASFIGEDASDQSAWSISGSGDVNGDGYNDFIIGAYSDEDGGGSYTGQTYLILSDQSGHTDAVHKIFVGSGDTVEKEIEDAGLIIDFSSCNSSSGYLTITEHNNQNAPGVTGGSFNRYWTISPTGLSSYQFSITFKYCESEVAESGGAEANMKIYRKDGLNWEEVTTTINTDKNTLTATGQTAFSDYGIGNSGNPMPVELTSFSATQEDNQIILNWETDTEIDNYGFEIERANHPAGQIFNLTSFTQVGFLEGAGNSNSPKEYTFTDDLTDLSPIPGAVSYRLKQIDNDGSFEYSDVITVETQNFASLPSEFKLNHNYPNPFNPETVISYNLPEKLNVQLTVFNSLGEKIKTLVNEIEEKGFYRVNFDASGLTSGIYFYRLEAGSFLVTKKMILAK